MKKKTITEIQHTPTKGNHNTSLRFEAGKFCLDIAKLIFGGVILAGLMKEDLDYPLLFSLGSCVVLIFCFYGFLLIDSSNKYKSE